jgi:hypothetical protein
LAGMDKSKQKKQRQIGRSNDTGTHLQLQLVTFIADIQTHTRPRPRIPIETQAPPLEVNVNRITAEALHKTAQCDVLSTIRSRFVTRSPNKSEESQTKENAKTHHITHAAFPMFGSRLLNLAIFREAKARRTQEFA